MDWARILAFLKIAVWEFESSQPSQAKPSQAKPSQAKPSQAKPSQAKQCRLWGLYPDGKKSIEAVASSKRGEIAERIRKQGWGAYQSDCVPGVNWKKIRAPFGSQGRDRLGK
jgi:hypothetical protein